MTPMPPDCAMAMASRASVTVSMAEESIGICSQIERVTRELHIDLVRQHIGGGRPDQHVIEGQRDVGVVGKLVLSLGTARRASANLFDGGHPVPPVGGFL